jgi:hypothetical protein
VELTPLSAFGICLAMFAWPGEAVDEASSDDDDECEQ